MKKLILLFCLTTAIALAVPSANVGTVAFTVQYDFVNNPDFSHFNVYMGPTSSNYTASTSQSTTNFTLTGFQRGQTVFFNMTAVNTNGLESDYTTEQSLKINSKPHAVAGFTPTQL